MKTLKNIVLYSFSVAVVLIIMELFAQSAYVETKSPTDFTEDYGRCIKANMDYVYFNEGFSMGRFNEGRYLNTYYPSEKSDSVIRIAALGDSYVEAFQVFERNHFLKLTEQKLNKALNDSVQILNFGRSGFDFGDMYAYYERMVKDYEPDIVLFFLSNADLNINQTDPLIPKVVETDSGLQITNSRMPDSYLQLFKKQLLIGDISVLYKMLNDTRKLVKSGELLPILFDKLYLKDANGNNHNMPTNKISPLSFKIINRLADLSKTNVYVINRGRGDLSGEFVKYLNPSINYLDLKNDTEIYENKNPHYWKVTSQTGHWNIWAHDRISVFLNQKLIKDLT